MCYRKLYVFSITSRKTLLFSIITVIWTEEQVQNNQGPGLPPLTTEEVAAHIEQFDLESLNLTEQQRQDIEAQIQRDLRMRNFWLATGLVIMGVILYFLLRNVDSANLENIWGHFRDLDAQNQAQYVKPVLNAAQEAIIRRRTE